MAKRNTRQLILDAALILFNEDGLSKVSTNHIADEVDISPGNLYYHFKNKEDIVVQLFEHLSKKLEPLLQPPADHQLNAEDMWLYIHLIFERIWEYRFFYRSLADINDLDPMLSRKLKRLIENKKSAATTICMNLKAHSLMDLPDSEIEVIADNITLTLCFWAYYKTQVSANTSENVLAQGVKNILLTVAGHITEPEASNLRYLAEQY